MREYVDVINAMDEDADEAINRVLLEAIARYDFLGPRYKGIIDQEVDRLLLADHQAMIDRLEEAVRAFERVPQPAIPRWDEC